MNNLTSPAVKIPPLHLNSFETGGGWGLGDQFARLPPGEKQVKEQVYKVAAESGAGTRDGEGDSPRQDDKYLYVPMTVYAAQPEDDDNTFVDHGSTAAGAVSHRGSGGIFASMVNAKGSPTLTMAAAAGSGTNSKRRPATGGTDTTRQLTSTSPPRNDPSQRTQHGTSSVLTHGSATAAGAAVLSAGSATKGYSAVRSSNHLIAGSTGTVSQLPQQQQQQQQQQQPLVGSSSAAALGTVPLSSTAARRYGAGGTNGFTRSHQATSSLGLQTTLSLAASQHTNTLRVNHVCNPPMLVSRMSMATPMQDMAVAPDGKSLWIAIGDDPVTMVGLKGTELETVHSIDSVSQVYCMAVVRIPGAKQTTFTLAPENTSKAPRRLKSSTPRTGGKKEKSTAAGASTSTATEVSFSGSEDTYALWCGLSRGNISIIDLDRRVEDGTIRGAHNQTVNKIWQLENGRVWSAGRDKAVRVWDPQARRKIKSRNIAAILTGLCYVPNTKHVWAIADDNMIRIYEGGGDNVRVPRQSHDKAENAIKMKSEVTLIEYCADGNVVWASMNKYTALMDPSTFETIETISFSITALAFHNKTAIVTGQGSLLQSDMSCIALLDVTNPVEPSLLYKGISVEGVSPIGIRLFTAVPLAVITHDEGRGKRKVISVFTYENSSQLNGLILPKDTVSPQRKETVATRSGGGGGALTITGGATGAAAGGGGGGGGGAGDGISITAASSSAATQSGAVPAFTKIYTHQQPASLPRNIIMDSIANTDASGVVVAAGLGMPANVVMGAPASLSATRFAATGEIITSLTQLKTSTESMKKSLVSLQRSEAPLSDFTRIHSTLMRWMMECDTHLVPPLDADESETIDKEYATPEGKAVAIGFARLYKGIILAGASACVEGSANANTFAGNSNVATTAVAGDTSSGGSNAGTQARQRSLDPHLNVSGLLSPSPEHPSSSVPNLARRATCAGITDVPFSGPSSSPNVNHNMNNNTSMLTVGAGGRTSEGSTLSVVGTGDGSGSFSNETLLQWVSSLSRSSQAERQTFHQQVQSLERHNKRIVDRNEAFATCVVRIEQAVRTSAQRFLDISRQAHVLLRQQRLYLQQQEQPMHVQALSSAAVPLDSALHKAQSSLPNATASQRQQRSTTTIDAQGVTAIGSSAAERVDEGSVPALTLSELATTKLFKSCERQMDEVQKVLERLSSVTASSSVREIRKFTSSLADLTARILVAQEDAVSAGLKTAAEGLAHQQQQLLHTGGAAQGPSEADATWPRRAGTTTTTAVLLSSTGVLAPHNDTSPLKAELAHFSNPSFQASTATATMTSRLLLFPPELPPRQVLTILHREVEELRSVIVYVNGAWQRVEDSRRLVYEPYEGEGYTVNLAKDFMQFTALWDITTAQGMLDLCRAEFKTIVLETLIGNKEENYFTNIPVEDSRLATLAADLSQLQDRNRGGNMNSTTIAAANNYNNVGLSTGAASPRYSSEDERNAILSSAEAESCRLVSTSLDMEAATTRIRSALASYTEHVPESIKRNPTVRGLFTMRGRLRCSESRVRGMLYWGHTCVRLLAASLEMVSSLLYPEQTTSINAENFLLINEKLWGWRDLLKDLAVMSNDLRAFVAVTEKAMNGPQASGGGGNGGGGGGSGGAGSGGVGYMSVTSSAIARDGGGYSYSNSISRDSSRMLGAEPQTVSFTDGGSWRTSPSRPHVTAVPSTAGAGNLHVSAASTTHPPLRDVTTITTDMLALFCIYITITLPPPVVFMTPEEEQNATDFDLSVCLEEISLSTRLLRERLEKLDSHCNILSLRIDDLITKNDSQGKDGDGEAAVVVKPSSLNCSVLRELYRGDDE